MKIESIFDALKTRRITLNEFPRHASGADRVEPIRKISPVQSLHPDYKGPVMIQVTFDNSGRPHEEAVIPVKSTDPNKGNYVDFYV